MLHYYFLKYWSRGLVGLMVAMVVGYFGIFSYALFAAQETEKQAALESAQLSATPPLNPLNLSSLDASPKTYQQSLQVFEDIQQLKDGNHDTSQLESMYADSVKNLSNNNEKEAVSQLQELQSQIAKLNSTVTPQPSDAIASISATPSIADLSLETLLGSGSAEVNDTR